ncbi:benzoate/H(+) symporter BenE family transporter, partial [Pseudoalteromonas sp. SIMBA_153]
MRFSISHIMAGATAVFVGYSSAVVLILEAVKSLNGSVELQSSWLLALGLAMGLSSILLSWRYKAPILTAWSTPGVALLIIALAGVSVAEAVG